MRVLVVEDDRQIRRQLVQALTTHGYVADTARNGEDGRFLGQTESYDAIILDLGLPVLDGLSVLQSWRQEGMKTPVGIHARLRKSMPWMTQEDWGAEAMEVGVLSMPEVSVPNRADTQRAKPLV